MTAVTGIGSSTLAVTTTAPVPQPLVQDAAPQPATQPSADDSNVVGSARTVSDPLAKVVITQYLDNSDQVVSQSPPSTVVAYLQSGLTVNGYPQKSATA